ncbi:uncharacterized protein LOC113419213 [Notechis scutatus]|uniref:Uncharacterized protein LOC113419213 n=1 Tax=Notechis scutatus TaxID=8663 RepID=A0A6J1UTH6_9SAUR|nr:uncharacterized protein LOC113419213 [Notechis scutatus]
MPNPAQIEPVSSCSLQRQLLPLSNAAVPMAWSPEGDREHILLQPFSTGENEKGIFSFSYLATEEEETQSRNRALAPEATFTHTAAGLRPGDRQCSGLSEEIKFFISEARSHGIATEFKKRWQLTSLATEPLCQPNQQYQLTTETFRFQGPPSPEPSMRNSASALEDEEQRDQAMSEDEDLIPDAPPFTGLFHPVLFKSWSTVQKGVERRAPEEPSDSQGLNNIVFSEPAITQKDIPYPKLFLNVVQRQWGQPCSIPAIPVIPHPWWK